MQSKVSKLIFCCLLLWVIQVTIMPAQAQQGKKGQTWVLVHGAWHGGWCWQQVSSRLREQGNTVYTPTLSGLGESRHLSHQYIDLETHITDIVNLLIMEDLHEVVLVGHSYAGIVIAGVVDRVPERISKVVWLDALIARNGESALSALSKEGRELLKKQAAPYHNISTAIWPAETFGVVDAAQQKWVNERLFLQPFKTFTQPLVLKHPYGNQRPMYYIACIDPWLEGLKHFAKRVEQDKNWHYYTLKAGHDAMVTAPAELTTLLLDIGQQ
ncbi:alpha/beta fold hydrolase [Chitinophaga nivalis]|uniref:Alpha/beta hydrolase n=1 Tax=Chitinophaga nivalis TaxID=2991709 RepID=A0ABT3IKK7_9BACT|nr:alpha/beta hydrolase family protein [Chitinophaga nivalis]MCW3465821.1 alpha/beta hydrolase [Chitinophaga nivalis]MCW3484488.1 alpha/beta hydrolase [Chitinophaga nivalis]